MFRRTIEPLLKKLFRQFPVVTVTGPRQSGKTTLCRHAFPDLPYVNLESLDQRKLSEIDPRGFLGQFPRGAILDEIQRNPDLLSYIQAIVDEKKRNGCFILTGSQQFEVMNSISQSLAGRTALLKLLPLSLAEISPKGSVKLDRFLYRGFFPRLHSQRLNPTKTLSDYFDTYIERDLRQIQEIRNFRQFETFVRLCAGRTGQLLNMQSLGNDVGVSQPTIRGWLNLLEASFVIFLLPPYFSTVSKRLVKTPKLYFTDVGLACFLLGIEEEKHLAHHPLRGNLVENLVVIEILKHRFNQGKCSNLQFYRDNVGNEVDVILENGPALHAVEIKSGLTINEDFFKGIRHFRKHIPSKGRCLLFYGGKERCAVRETEVWPIAAVHEALGT